SMTASAALSVASSAIASATTASATATPAASAATSSTGASSAWAGVWTPSSTGAVVASAVSTRSSSIFGSLLAWERNVAPGSRPVYGAQPEDRRPKERRVHGCRHRRLRVRLGVRTLSARAEPGLEGQGRDQGGPEVHRQPSDDEAPDMREPRSFR